MAADRHSLPAPRTSSCARWVRVGAVGSLDLHAACAGLAAAQPRDAAPIVLWGSARADLCLGPASRPASPARDLPTGELAWAGDGQPVFVLIVPRRRAPGRAARWAAWGLSAAAATCRRLGMAVYVEAHALWLHGRRIAACSTSTIGDCALVASSLPVGASVLPAGAIEAMFRGRIEAQHGWQFEHSWPSPAERDAIGEARRALADAPHGGGDAMLKRVAAEDSR